MWANVSFATVYKPEISGYTIAKLISPRRLIKY
jgi:hypothetical protein